MAQSKGILQIIDKDGVFKDSLSQDIVEWGFTTSKEDINYFVVAVLGCQSSGKSTLLNMLFGTKFLMLEVAKNGTRQQTTQGVWMGLSGTPQQKLLIFDVEGTDSRERGEEHFTWERKTSLFSLALSEILIINMWAKDIGRYEGANYGLLKTVFELNLQIFQTKKKNKTMLYFILRDYNEREAGTIDAIGPVIIGDMNKLWNEMPKPEHFKESKVSDFFDFKFTGLSYKIQEDKFTADVNDLKKKFFEPAFNDYILKKEYKSDVPADGFSMYAKTIWDTILSEKDLNLPSQKQMLAMYRCEEIAKEAFVNVEEQCKSWNDLVKTGMISAFGDLATDLTVDTLEKYESSAKRYDQQVMEEKKKLLLDWINSKLVALFNSQLKLLKSTVEELFQSYLSQSFDEQEPNEKFKQEADSIKKKVLSNFKKEATCLLVPKFFDNWSFDHELVDLERHIDEKISQLQKAQLDLFQNIVVEDASKNLTQNANIHFDRTKQDMWSEISKVYNKETEYVIKRFEEIVDTGFNIDKFELDKRREAIKAKLFAALKQLSVEKAKQLESIMISLFKKNFELASDGAPRTWNMKEAEIRSLWHKCKLESEELVDLFVALRLDDKERSVHFFSKKLVDGVTSVTSVDELPKFDNKKILLTIGDANEIIKRFRSATTTSFSVAMAERERIASQRSIPLFMIVLLVVLGWNEMMWILSTLLFSPIFLIFLGMIGGGAYFLHQNNLLPVVIATATPLIKTAKDKILESVHNLAQVPGQQPVNPNINVENSKKND
eukprot:TRINITY_DN8612_c0_g1_i1.p1 TRINITY_DN8612_c0_g1~~TRINITY_DN8612_c0_g1_i1.p1  ORF type:complete len:776 (+),score=231.36 TRINITY_DN8612_c0_g1_i1:30-2357(+)